MGKKWKQKKAQKQNQKKKKKRKKNSVSPLRTRSLPSSHLGSGGGMSFTLQLPNCGGERWLAELLCQLQQLYPKCSVSLKQRLSPHQSTILARGPDHRGALQEITSAIAQGYAKIVKLTSSMTGNEAAIALVMEIPAAAATSDELARHQLLAKVAVICNRLGWVMREAGGGLSGCPAQSALIAPQWLSSTVVTLARSIHACENTERLSILADALQDAGCDNEIILTHCRLPQPHVHACWVTELILAEVTQC